MNREDLMNLFSNSLQNYKIRNYVPSNYQLTCLTDFIYYKPPVKFYNKIGAKNNPDIVSFIQKSTYFSEIHTGVVKKIIKQKNKQKTKK